MAELEPGNAGASLHHSMDIRIRLFDGCVIPSLASHVGVIRLITATITDDSDLVFDHFMEERNSRLPPPLYVRDSIIFNQPLEEGQHFVSFRIDAADIYGI